MHRDLPIATRYALGDPCCASNNRFANDARCGAINRSNLSCDDRVAHDRAGSHDFCAGHA